jgi:hypothetical protein
VNVGLKRVAGKEAFAAPVSRVNVVALPTESGMASTGQVPDIKCH